jgi:hypothetical protein
VRVLTRSQFESVLSIESAVMSIHRIAIDVQHKQKKDLDALSDGKLRESNGMRRVCVCIH